MTVALAIQTRSHIIFGVDSRVTDSDSGAIVTDDAKKFVRRRAQTAVFAGDWSGCQAAMSALVSGDLERPIKAKNWESLVYDRQTDRLLSVAADGAADEVTTFAAIGSGSDVAIGYLDAALRSNASLQETKRVARAALRAACKRHSSCGGRLRCFAIERY